MTPHILVVVAATATVLGTVGGVLEQLCTAGSLGYKVGVVLASVGIDLASLAKVAS
jgi:hypothetical protein